MSADSFLTAAEIAKQLKVSKMTVYRLCDDLELPSVRVGRSRRIPREAFVEYLREHFTAAAA